MLRTSVIVLLTCILLKAGSVGVSAQELSSSCGVITDALRSIESLKAGGPRSQLERDFQLDGGMQFAAKSRYVFKACHYIKIDVKLSGKGIEDRADFLPTDTITEVSRPYLEFPTKD